ncbi:hypothetical protein K504DRAFT_489061 [Pleomassaria siparia CBS 279.74]|uniref:BTB domain-containing protein n=1 Tax=Pleomassaria siparia CBS 279.74 TaxID=1314801 RepID=A0A6G1KJG1_9PLEO|nr:hypothetical protein K504DRAFT_489061 [Pleomassaria siparia CBS 279.74]
MSESLDFAKSPMCGASMKRTIQLHQGPTMEVIVGADVDQRMTWYLPKALLSHHSGFFRAACNQPFKEGLENTITLSDVDPKVFEVFVQWLYHDRFPCDFATIGCDLQLRVWPGFQTWILGDKFMAKEFQDCSMRWIWEYHAPHGDEGVAVILPEEAQYCYENTLPKSKLRKFVSDSLCQSWGDSAYACDKLGWESVFVDHMELALDVLFHSGGYARRTVKSVESYFENPFHNGQPHASPATT